MHRIALARLYILHVSGIVSALAALAFLVLALIKGYQLGPHESARKTAAVFGTFAGSVVDAYSRATRQKR